MDERGYGSGFPNWSGGSGNRGSGHYDTYGDSSSYDGYGQMKRGLSGGSLSSSTHADEVIAKINQRLDMLSQMEGNLKRDRYDQYESYDSQSSAYTSRDLYRSGGGNYGYDDGRGDMMLGQRGGLGGGGYDSQSSSYGLAKMRQNMRESFIGGSSRDGGGGGGWAGAGRRSPRRGGSGRGGYGDRRSDPTPLGGGGRGKLPSLLSDRLYPMSGGFQRGSNQGPHDFPGRHFGGGPRAGRQRGRKRPLNKQQNNPQKKRKQIPEAAEEPESKVNKVEGQEAEEGNPDELSKKNGDECCDEEKADADQEAAADGEDGEEKTEEGQGKKKQGKQKQQEKAQKAKKKRGFLDRMTYACSLCKFRSFYKDEMEVHLQSRFHKDHFKYLASQLSKPTTDFLEEYLLNKYKKTEERITQLDNFNTIICNFYKEQDLTRELGMEHFLKKVEAAHCVACDIFIPMQPHLIEKHLKSHEHNYHRKEMMECSKKASLAVARSILNHKFIGMKLEKYLKGENPFTDKDENDLEDSILTEAAEGGEAVGGAEGLTEAMEGDKEPALEDEVVEESEKTDEQETLKVEEEADAQDEENGRQLEGNPDEDEGFEMGDDDGGYFVRDEVGDEGFQFEQ